MNFSLGCYSPPGDNSSQKDCIVISQNRYVAVLIPRLPPTRGRIIKEAYHVEIDATNLLSPECYDLSQIETVDSDRVSAKVRGWLTPNSAKRLDFVFRSLLAPRSYMVQTMYNGLLATHKFDDSTNLNTYNKKDRPVLILKVWTNGMALVLPISSSTIENGRRQLLPIGRVGMLKKSSSIALDQWYSVPLKGLSFHDGSRLPLLATRLIQARCLHGWAS